MNRDKVVDEMRILLVEDDVAIAEVVTRGLVSSGYHVDCARDGRRGLGLALTGTYGVIILDLMLPLVDGMRVCEEVRSTGVSTPILMLTAKDAVGDRVKGLESGADDYLVKPFNFDELLARVKALLRRDKVNRGKVIQIGHLTVDTQGRTVTVNGEAVSLNQHEYELLEALALNEGRILTRDAIQARVWDNEDSFSNVVDVQVRRLRAKIEAPGLPQLIHTVRGIGYSMRRPD
jgi:DNA-binding response OmpR family regulator